MRLFFHPLGREKLIEIGSFHSDLYLTFSAENGTSFATFPPRIVEATRYEKFKCVVTSGVTGCNSQLL